MISSDYTFVQIRTLIERGASSDAPYVDISVSAQWKEDGNTKRDWAITVELSEQITSDTLLERVKKLKIPRDETLKIIREKLDPDSDVAMTSIRVNLLCPVGCLRMTTPSRTKKCNHLQVSRFGKFLEIRLLRFFGYISFSQAGSKRTYKVENDPDLKLQIVSLS